MSAVAREFRPGIQPPDFPDDLDTGGAIRWAPASYDLSEAQMTAAAPSFVHDISRFDVSPQRGFLPPQDPLRQLPPAFSAWDQIAADLPKLLMTHHLRRTVERMPTLDPSPLAPGAQSERAMMLLSFIGHAYVWGSGPVTPRIPASLAVPWHQLSRRLGRPPVLSYASYALHNWRRIDPHGPIAIGNIALVQNFWGGADEEWFVLIHVDIEAKAAPALAALMNVQQAVMGNQPQHVTKYLGIIGDSLEAMYATLCRMPEFCDPYIYFNRVRPYIHAWKNQPALPQGLIYDGVSEYNNKPQQFRGETGAQSSIVPALDALLGVAHAHDPLRAYLMEMRDYMPPRHRAFVEAIEQGPAVRDYVLARQDASLRNAYDRCVSFVEQFRAKHLEYAAKYIHNQRPKDPSNPSQVGTGGTPFMPYLKKHLDETSGHRIA
jgi:indoleamine 2,3-dioxygenase